ncbi:pyocin knob domain-containing protein [Serratia marcescens]|uniref:pyocin knob domain-containing protein n=1 Tax=Serratia marcescens TaxID=615 RepID=UPI0006998B87|nr:pyocin knob domain-containing protein [Serratia marcescens]
MSKNEYLPFATATNADVMKPDDYQKFPTRGPGFGTGIAKTTQMNTVWRQASVIASVVAQFIANRSGDDVLDDGNLNKLQASLEKALKAKIIDSAMPLYPTPLTVDLNTLGATSHAGVYCQTANTAATAANHYPVNLSGTLMVTPSAYGCQQEYTTYSTRQKFVRGLTGPWNGKDGPWSEWASPPAYGWGMGPQHRDDAYNNTAMVYRINGTSLNAPGPNVYGVISAPCDGGPSTSYFAASNSGRAYIGYSSVPEKGITWAEVYTTKNPPTAAGINAADVRNNMAAKMGIERVLTGGAAPTSAGVWSVENSTWAGTPWGSVICTTNGSDVKTTAGNQRFNHYLQISHEEGAKPGLRVAINVNGTASGWYQALMSYGGTLTGPLTTPYVASTPNVTPEGAGAYADQLNSKAPFFQPNWDWDVNPGGILVPIAKGTSTLKGKGYPTAVSYSYLRTGNNEFAHPVIHVRGDNNFECIWDFNPQNGGISSKAGTFATQEWVNALIQNVGQMSVSGTQWWARFNLNGGALIAQGGFFDGRISDAGVIERVPLNISVPNTLLGVWTIIRNYAQGYETTWNPQVQDLTGARDAFNWLHGTKEREIYWIAVGY